MLAASLAAGVEARAGKLVSIISKGVVRIVVFAALPPFGLQSANCELEDFDIGKMKLAAQALGVRLELVANRMLFLFADKADMNIALCRHSRARKVDHVQRAFPAPASTSLCVTTAAPVIMPRFWAPAGKESQPSGSGNPVPLT